MKSTLSTTQTSGHFDRSDRTPFARARVGGLLSCLAMCVLTLSASAAEPRVRDEGAFFSPGAVAEVESQLETLNQTSKRNVIVETYQTAPDEVRGKVEAADAPTRTAALAAFAEDRAKQLNADAYVFVTRTPSHLRFVSRAMGAVDRDRISGALLGSFKEKQFDQGLRSTTSSLAGAFASATASTAGGGSAKPGDGPRPLPGWSSGNTNPGAARTAEPGAIPANDIEPAPAPVKKPAGGMSMMTMILLAVGAFILFKIVRAMFGARRQNAGGFGPGTNNPNGPPPLPGQQGYGQPGQQQGGGGGFGRGMAGGVMGGLLGGYLGSQVFGQGRSDQGSDSAGGSDPSGHAGEQDQGSDYSSGGGDFGGDSGGGDSSGGDF